MDEKSDIYIKSFMIIGTSPVCTSTVLNNQVNIKILTLIEIAQIIVAIVCAETLIKNGRTSDQMSL